MGGKSSKTKSKHGNNKDGKGTDKQKNKEPSSIPTNPTPPLPQVVIESKQPLPNSAVSEPVKVPVAQEEDDEKNFVYVDKGESSAFPLCGISVDFVNSLVEKGVIDERWTISQVVDKFVKLETADMKSSYVEYMCKTPKLAKHVKSKADFFLSYAWSYQIGQVLSALKKRKGLFMWMDCFIVNQHESGVKDLDTWLKTFGSAVQSIGLIVPVLIPWNAPVPCTRSWCTFEFFIASKYDVKTECELSAVDHDKLTRLLTEDRVDVGDLQNIFSDIDIEKAQAFKQTDQEAILALVRSENSIKVNDMISKPLKQWILNIAKQCLSENLKQYEEMRTTADDYDLMYKYISLSETYSQVSSVYQFLGDLKSSLEFKRISLDYLKKSDPNSDDLAFQTNNLALIYKHNGLYEEALPLYREAITLYEQKLNPNQVGNQYLQTRNNLAVLLIQMGRIEEALEIENAVLAFYRKSGAGSEHNVSQCLSATGICALKLGKLQDAERDLEESLKIGLLIFGDDNIGIVVKQNNLAKVLVRKQDPADFRRAIDLCETSYRICCRVLSKEHIMTGESLLLKACALWRLGDRDKAADLAKEGLGYGIAQLTADSPDAIEQQKEWKEFKEQFP
jgi:tetratricopeptide (TPR) repeat protein